MGAQVTAANRIQKGLHLITQSTPNGRKVQILLEELKEVYGTECKSWSLTHPALSQGHILTPEIMIVTVTLIDIDTMEQKKDWFLKLDPNGTLSIIETLAKNWSVIDSSSGRIPVVVDNTKTPPFPVMETSAILLYLEKEYDLNDTFGFKDELERNECLQWMFFWHGSVSILLLLVRILSKII